MKRFFGFLFFLIVFTVVLSFIATLTSNVSDQSSAPVSLTSPSTSVFVKEDPVSNVWSSGVLEWWRIFLPDPFFDIVIFLQRLFTRIGRISIVMRLLVVKNALAPFFLTPFYSPAVQIAEFRVQDL